MKAKNMKRRHSGKKPRSKPYTKGQLNKLIDSVLHPFFGSNPELIPVDALLHGIVEANVSESTVKFIRYSLPEIVKRALTSNQ